MNANSIGISSVSAGLTSADVPLPESKPAPAPAPSAKYVPSSPINSTADMKREELKGAEYTIGDEQVVRAIEQAIKAIQGKTTSLQFSIHERTKQIMVKVLDKSTGEVIREIPPEKNLDFVAKLWEMAGILVDERR